VTVSKDALEKLSNATVDFDVRLHELVDAIVVHTNCGRRPKDPLRSSEGLGKVPEYSSSPCRVSPEPLPESFPESY